MANHFKPLTWCMKWLQLVARDCLEFVDKRPTKVQPTNTVISTPTLQSEMLEFAGVEYKFTLVTKEGPVSIYREEFSPTIKDLGVFGKKLVPSQNTQWNRISVLDCRTIEQAAQMFIQNNFQDRKSLDVGSKVEQQNSIQKSSELPKSVRAPESSTQGSKTPANEVVIGKLMEAGVKQFPDRNKEGSTYENFAIVVNTKRFPKTLQGEGLRDALTQSRIQIGDEIIVKRLDQVMVPLLDKSTQKPLLNEDGSAKLTPKWQWSITKKK